MSFVVPLPRWEELGEDGGSGICFSAYTPFYATVINNTIVGNKAESGGGGIYCWVSGGEAKIRNNIIVNNSSTEGGGGIHRALQALKLIIDHNDVWNNTAPKGDYYGCTPGAHDIHTDPFFVDVANGDYHLQSAKYGHWTLTGWSPLDPKTSPCIDAGDPNDDFSLEPEPNGGRINQGYDGNTPEATRSDPLPHPHPVHYVSPSGKNIPPYDTPEKATVKIQDAINEATSGDTVRVAEGTYDQGSWNGVQMKKGVNLEGGYNSSFTSTSRKPGVYKSYIIAGGISGRGQGHGSDTVIGANDTILDGFVLFNSLWHSVIRCDGVTSMKISHNIITGGDNAAIELHASSPTIVNNVIAYDYSMISASIRCEDGSSPIIENNIFFRSHYAAEAAIGHDETSAPIAKYNAFYGMETGDDVFVNPQEPASGQDYDFHLKPGSPCIDAGNPDSDFSNEPQPNGGRVNMGAYGNTTEAEPTPTTPWFDLSLNKGINLITVPLKDERVTKVSDLAKLLSPDVSLITSRVQGKFLSFIPGVTPETALANVEIKGYTGLIVQLKTAKSVTFKGIAWSGDVQLTEGINLIGIPLKDPGLAKVSNLAKRLEGKVSQIISYNVEQGKFQSFTPGKTPETAPVNVPIDGGVGLIVLAKEATNFTVTGEAWENKAPAAPPITQFMTTPTSSPVLELDGVIKSENTGATLNGISVTVRLTHSPLPLGEGLGVREREQEGVERGSEVALTDTTGGIAGDGQFSVTFVDFSGNHPVQVGDLFEISVDGTDRIEPVRYTVTESDIQAGRVVLGEFVARLIPSRSELMPNFPNPFNPETWIPFKLAEGGKVTITIYDVHGRLVRTLSLGYVPAGVYQTKAKAVYWDGRNESGERVASGVYFYNLQSGKFSATRKIVILK